MAEWIKDGKLPGLYKRIRANGNAWVVKARQSGTKKVVTVTLGRCDLLSISNARKAAKQPLLQLSHGINPNEERRKKILSLEKIAAKQQAMNLTLSNAIAQFNSLKISKKKTSLDRDQTLFRNFGDWYELPIRSITREMVLERFQDIINRVSKKRGETRQAMLSQGKAMKEFKSEAGRGEAQRAFRYLQSVINSFKNDTYDGELLIPNNPCDVLRDKKVRFNLVPRNRYLSESNLSELIDLLGRVHHPEYQGRMTVEDADYIALLLFSGLRSDEARVLRWEDVDFADEIYTVINTKNHREHRLPMTNVTKNILVRAKNRWVGVSSYVFPSPINKDTPASMSRTFERLIEELHIECSAHDLRRTFATLASEMGVDLAKVGEALNHKKQGTTANYIQSTMSGLRNTLQAVENAILWCGKEENVQALSSVDIDNFSIQ